MPLRSKTPPDPERQLMIKTKTCQRLLKEVEYYKKEVKENEETLSKMKEEKRNIYDIKKFQEVVDESYMMIPDSQRRLNDSIKDLQLFITTTVKNENENEDDTNNNNNNKDNNNILLQKSDWFLKANEILKIETKQQQQTNDTNNDDIVEITSLDNLKDGEAF